MLMRTQVTSIIIDILFQIYMSDIKVAVVLYYSYPSEGRGKADTCINVSYISNLVSEGPWSILDRNRVLFEIMARSKSSECDSI